MKKTLLILLVNLCLGSNQNFLPMEVGHSWHYENGYSITVTDVLTVDNVSYFQLSREIEDLSVFPIYDGCFPSEFYFAVNQQGGWCEANLYAVSTDELNTFKIMDFHYPENEPLVFYASSDSIEYGQSINYGNENVETPAGNFLAVKMGFDPSPATDDEWLFWFAEDVGIVKFGSGWLPESSLINHLDIAEMKILPFNLNSVYPNPFNAQTKITYTLNISQVVDLSIFDMRGRKIETLQRQFQPSGNYKAVWQAEHAASGFYMIQINVGNQTHTTKVTLIK